MTHAADDTLWLSGLLVSGELDVAPVLGIHLKGLMGILNSYNRFEKVPDCNDKPGKKTLESVKNLFQIVDHG